MLGLKEFNDSVEPIYDNYDDMEQNESWINQCL